MIEDFIRMIPLFAQLPENEVHYLANSLRQVKFPTGTLFIRENQPARRFFILLEGKVEIIKALGSKDERLLAVRKPGSFVGEMGLLSDEGLHTASVRAQTPLQLLEMTHEDFDALLHRQPTLAYEMVRTLSSRLDRAENLTIRDLRRKNIELAQAYRDLQAAQAQIIEKERLEQELEVARGIQSSILPQSVPTFPGYDFGALMIPMRAVGGDFFDFIPLKDNRLGIVIGDVSDHGVPAALFMALTVTLLRSEARRSISPRRVLTRVNQQLLDMNETGMFVTILYGVLNLITRDFTYVRAGHVLPIILDAKDDWMKVTLGKGQLMGIIDEPELVERTITFAPGNTLFLYTDGVTETTDHQGDLFDEHRLQQTIFAHRREPAQTLCDQVFTAVSSHLGAASPQDDITMVTIQFQ